MYVRALLVVLIVLNIGVGAWWAFGSTPSVAPVPEPPHGVATLVLAPGAPASGRTAQGVALAPIAPATPPAKPEPAPAPRCVTLGPYASERLARAAAAKAGDVLTRFKTREVATGEPASYRVMLPVKGDRTAAEEVAKRIAAAGFKDYYVMGSDDGDSAVALGQYRSHDGAERRQNELAAAGFAADLSSVGGGDSQWWIDAELSGAAGLAQQRAGASREKPLDCASLR